jgi:cytochrome b subunit of formate dehydrogenase
MEMIIWSTGEIILTEDWGWACQGVKLDFRSKDPATKFLNYGTGLSKLKFIYHNKSYYFAVKIKILFFVVGELSSLRGINCQRRI